MKIYATPKGGGGGGATPARQNIFQRAGGAIRRFVNRIRGNVVR